MTCHEALVHTAAEHRPQLAHEIERAVRLALGWEESDPVEPELLGGTLDRYYRIGLPGGLAAVLEVNDPNEILFGVRRERERAAARRAAEERLGPAVLFAPTRDGVLVTRYAGAPVAATDDTILTEVARAIRALHALEPGAGFNDSFSPFRSAERLRREAEQRGAVFPAELAAAWTSMEEIERVIGRSVASVPSHNSLRPSRVRRDDAGTIRFVGWEQAGLADPLHDVAIFAREAALTEARARRFLGACLAGPVSDATWARFRLLQGMVDLRHCLAEHLSARLRGTTPSVDANRRLADFVAYARSAEFRRHLEQAAERTD